MHYDKIREAIEEMKADCDLKMQTYEGLSVRESLSRLGYSTAEQDSVITYLADHGFSHCLDPNFGDRPPYFACVWGPDQLKSRLECIH